MTRKGAIPSILRLLAVVTSGFFVNVLINEHRYYLAALLAIVGVAAAVWELLINRPQALDLIDSTTLTAKSARRFVSACTLGFIEGELQRLLGELHFQRGD